MIGYDSYMTTVTALIPCVSWLKVTLFVKAIAWTSNAADYCTHLYNRNEVNKFYLLKPAYITKLDVDMLQYVGVSTAIVGATVWSGYDK